MVLESKSEAAFWCLEKGGSAGREETGELGICILLKGKQLQKYIAASHMNPQAPVGTGFHSIWERFRGKIKSNSKPKCSGVYFSEE